MMPLCTTAISPPETCGCALTGVGAPCVAQRVCEMPGVPVEVRRFGPRREVRHARGRNEPLELRRLAAADDRETARIVAAVFEAADAVDQDRNDVARGDRADNAAHGVSLSEVSVS